MDQMTPSEGASVNDWLTDAAAAAQAVVDHASDPSAWGAVGWLATIAGSLVGVAKFAKFLPIPAVQQIATAVDSFLPQLTGRDKTKTERVANAVVQNVTTVLDILEQVAPDRIPEAIKLIKAQQARAGVRDHVKVMVGTAPKHTETSAIANANREPQPNEWESETDAIVRGEN